MRYRGASHGACPPIRHSRLLRVASPRICARTAAKPYSEVAVWNRLCCACIYVRARGCADCPEVGPSARARDRTQVCPGADVTGVSPSPGADVGGDGPVEVRTWYVFAAATAALSASQPALPSRPSLQVVLVSLEFLTSVREGIERHGLYRSLTCAHAAPGDRRSACDGAAPCAHCEAWAAGACFEEDEASSASIAREAAFIANAKAPLEPDS